MIADFLLAVGGLIGLLSKLMGAIDQRTVWNRKSSGLQVITYPFTALLPFLMLDLNYSFAVATLNFLVWVAIYIWRSPEGEDFLGR